MNKDDFFYLGKILKTYGRKGHLLLYLDVDDPSRYRKVETLFIGIENDRIPFTLTELELHPKNQARIHFEDVNSTEDAEIFTGREIFLPASMLPKLKGKRFYFHEITGFSVIDQRFGNIGTVTSVLDLPQQALLQVRHGDREILIPVVDNIMKKIDRKMQEIHIIAPEGLIEIYL
jgi:16S rRNA processing protein RimM